MGIERVRVVVGIWSGPDCTVEIDLSEGRLRITDGAARSHRHAFRLNRNEVERLRARLSALRLDEWKAWYLPVHPAPCASSWCVEFESQGRQRTCRGEDAYPEQWARLCRLMEELAGEAWQQAVQNRPGTNER